MTAAIALALATLSLLALAAWTERNDPDAAERRRRYDR